MAAATPRETSDARKGRLLPHQLGQGLLRDLAFPVTRRVGPTARSAWGRFDGSNPITEGIATHMGREAASGSLPRFAGGSATAPSYTTSWDATFGYHSSMAPKGCAG